LLEALDLFLVNVAAPGGSGEAGIGKRLGAEDRPVAGADIEERDFEPNTHVLFLVGHNRLAPERQAIVIELLNRLSIPKDERGTGAVDSSP
jgi:hypothetical protein